MQACLPPPVTTLGNQRLTSSAFCLKLAPMMQEGGMTMNSSRTDGFKTLARKVPAPRLRNFLTELANFSGDQEGATRLSRRYANLLPPPRHLRAQLRQSAPLLREHHPEVSLEQEDEVVLRGWLIPLRNWVQTIWRAPDLRTKRFYLYRLLSAEMYTTEGKGLEITNLMFVAGPVTVEFEPPSAFEQALEYLLGSIHRTRHCANPECRHQPYFFAQRRTQKYCSEACAEPAQRRAKRAWWLKHGDAWREARRKKPTQRRRRTE